MKRSFNDVATDKTKPSKKKLTAEDVTVMEATSDDIVLAAIWRHWQMPLMQNGEWESFDEFADDIERVDCDSHGRILYLNLSGLGLEGTVPPEIGQFSSLQELYLNNNRLTSIPPELGTLSSLQELNLDDNELTSLPSELGKLSSLIVLDVSHNRLTSIPPELSNLSSLQDLYLRHNLLESVPAELGNLSCLRELYLSNNRLTTIPSEFSKLTSLKRAELFNNQLTEGVPSVFRNLSSLKTLYL